MKQFLPSAFLLLVSSFVAHAADPHFLGPESLDAVALLPPPPVAASAEGVADLDAVLKAQGTRADADVTRTKAESKLSPAAFQSVLGPEFTAENFPHTFSLLEDAAQDSKQFSTKAKEYFSRLRPKLADARVQPAVHGDVDPSYPSGHSTRSMMWARILCEIAPEKKDALLDRGEEIGWDRVIIGVHYPTDVYAGEVLGQALAQAVRKNEEFQSRLAEAKQEFKSFGTAHPIAASASPSSSAISP